MDPVKLAILNMVLYTLRLHVLAILIANSRRSFNKLIGSRLHFNLELFDQLDSCFSLNQQSETSRICQFHYEKFTDIFGVSLNETLENGSNIHGINFFVANVADAFGTYYERFKTRLACIGPIMLPDRAGRKTKHDPIKTLQGILNSKIAALADSCDEYDFSVLFIGIKQSDKHGGRSKSMDYPNLLRLTRPGYGEIVYQTSAALYACITSIETIYYVRILSRHVRREKAKFYTFGYYFGTQTPLAGFERSDVKDHTFPSFMRVNGYGDSVFDLRGIVMFGNFGLDRSEVPHPYSTNNYEIIRRTKYGGTITFEHIKKLCSFSRVNKGMDTWLDDTIVNEIIGQFVAFMGDTFSLLPNQNLVLKTFISEFIRTYENAGSDDTDETVQRLYSHYNNLKSLWDYKNIFEFADGKGTIHIPINMPIGMHWMYVSILVSKRLIVVMDSMYNQERCQIVGHAIFQYIKFEANGNPVYMNDWTILTKVKVPQQKDTVSCGVFTILFAIRSVCLVYSYRSHEIFKDWDTEGPKFFLSKA
jgi:hypothetical protein